VSLDAVALLRRLVRIERWSGQEEEARDLVAATLREHGATPRISGRNVRAETGPAGAPALLLNSHLDTVRAGAGWTRDPRDPGDDPDRVHGLGSNDAGGSGVAMLEAFISLAGEGLPVRLVLALTCDEETGGEGLEALRPELGELHAAVIGEPTAMAICPAQRGLMRFEVTVSGRSAHASRPWQGENAIEGALEDAARLVALSFPGEHPLLGRATLALTRIEGGTAPNVIPDRCRITGDARPTPLHPNEEIVAAVRDAVRRGEVTTMRARMTPVETPLDAAVVEAAREVLPEAPITGFGGVSDLFHVRDVAGLVLGPGAPERSHAPDEWIGVGEIREAVDVYRRIVRAWARRVVD
jgi:acetylornithine deacetylase